MKKLLFFICALALVACKKEPEVDYAIISGKILNKAKGEVSINTFDRSFTEPVTLSDDGSFMDTLSVEKNSYVLFDGQNPVFLHLEPGYHINISYDATDFEKTLLITGKGAEVNNYLVAKGKNEMAFMGNSRETFMLDETAYKEKANALKQSQDSILKATKGISEDYLANEKRNLQYAYLNHLNDYENAHKYFTKDDEFKVSDGFLKELDGFDYNNEADFKFSNDYKGLVTTHYKDEAKKLVAKDSMASDLAYLKTVSAIPSETIKNGLLFDYANYNMGYSDDVDAFYNFYMANSTDKKNNDLVTEKYNKLMGLTKGKPSPTFNGYENYAGGTTSLEDLKGKYVYIDVWATWCGPCIRQIPALKEVESKYHDKNIKFVSISIDNKSDYEKWKTMIAEKELGGIQLFADSDWKSEFVTNYQIEGIPRFILIDTEGNIVDANAPRPSDPELITLFNSLNI